MLTRFSESAGSLVWLTRENISGGKILCFETEYGPARSKIKCNNLTSLNPKHT
jgi:hypothetical protein